MSSKMRHILGLERAIGPAATLRVLAGRAARSTRPLEVPLIGLRDRPSISLRPRESDLFVVSQVLGWREYDIGARRVEALNRLAETWSRDGLVPLVIDGGANVGYSALYFADAYPQATILAVEPDAEAFAVMQHNVRLNKRIIAVHAAIWKDDQGVALLNGDNGSWSNRVAEAQSGKVPSATLDQLVARIPGGKALIVMLDIEGAEREACAASGSVLREAPCVMVEPHDFMLPGAGCLTPLFAMLSGRRLDTLLNGENLILMDADLSR
jgi:FkbM family methyltransferase